MEIEQSFETSIKKLICIEIFGSRWQKEEKETALLWLKKDSLRVHCTKLETLRQIRLIMDRENAFHHPNSLTHENIQLD